MSFLQLTNVNIGYPTKKGDRVIQSGLALSADRGEMIALIGKNGCGKSTLIRSIACLQPILGGMIQLDNKDLTHMSASQRSRLVSVVLTGQDATASFTSRDPRSQ